MKTERLQILNMIQDGKITADEGANLLEALENSHETENNFSDSKAKWLKIRVLDPKDDTKVNITLPISLINLGVKLASKFSPDLREVGLTEDHMNEIFAAIKNGDKGKIMDVDSGSGEKVEILIE